MARVSVDEMLADLHDAGMLVTFNAESGMASVYSHRWGSGEPHPGGIVIPWYGYNHEVSHHTTVTHLWRWMRGYQVRREVAPLRSFPGFGYHDLYGRRL